jgi:hypothetical protein
VPISSSARAKAASDDGLGQRGSSGHHSCAVGIGEPICRGHWRSARPTRPLDPQRVYCQPMSVSSAQHELRNARREAEIPLVGHRQATDARPLPCRSGAARTTGSTTRVVSALQSPSASRTRSGTSAPKEDQNHGGRHAKRADHCIAALRSGIRVRQVLPGAWGPPAGLIVVCHGRDYARVRLRPTA